MPKDFGDPHPSDIGDVPPINPTENFDEVDYSIQSIGKTVPRTRRNPQLVKPSGEKIPDIIRDTFSGIITVLGDKTILPRHFTVLTQNMRRVEAIAGGHEDFYSDLRIGDSVVITRGELPDTWILSGSPRNDELPTIILRTTGASGNNVIAVPFTLLESQTGDDTILLQNGNGIKIGGVAGQEFQIQVLLDITIECTNSNAQAGPPPVTAQAACLDSNVFGPSLSLKYPFKSIRFDKALGFKVFQPSPELAEVTISGKNTFYSLYQPGGGGTAVWTNWPIIANALTVGAMAPQAWLILQNSAGIHVWLGTGNKNLKYVFPDNEPKTGSHLILEAVQGEGVKLKHSAIGGKGTMSVYGCDYTCKEFKVEDGLIISGPGISAPSSSSSVSIQPPVRDDYKPCG